MHFPVLAREGYAILFSKSELLDYDWVTSLTKVIRVQYKIGK